MELFYQVIADERNESATDLVFVLMALNSPSSLQDCLERMVLRESRGAGEADVMGCYRTTSIKRNSKHMIWALRCVLCVADKAQIEGKLLLMRAVVSEIAGGLPGEHEKLQMRLLMQQVAIALPEEFSAEAWEEVNQGLQFMDLDFLLRCHDNLRAYDEQNCVDLLKVARLMT